MIIHLCTNYTIVHKMKPEEARILKEELASYNLTGRLLDKLQVVVDGGVAQTTVYKAFRVGGTTPLLRRILTTAQEILREHQEMIAEYEQPQPATA